MSRARVHFPPTWTAVYPETRNDAHKSEQRFILKQGMTHIKAREGKLESRYTLTKGVGCDVHSIRQFPFHFPSRASSCAITVQLDSTVA